MNSPSDDLIFLVFKENLPSRTFRVPLRWIHQLGWAAAGLSLLALAGVGATVWSVTARHRPMIGGGLLPSSGGSSAANARIAELEQQVRELEAKKMTLPSSTTANADAAAEASPVPMMSPDVVAKSSPIQSKPFLFRGLPEEIQALPSNPSTIPISIRNTHARWEGKTLKVRFNLLWTASERGTQQGRIMILARGPSTILGYPDSIFQNVDKDALIDPNSGEYFSVSRFRQVNAEFGPLNRRDSIREVEIVILSQAGQLLFHEKLQPEGGAEPRSASPAKSSGAAAQPATNATAAGAPAKPAPAVATASPSEPSGAAQ